MLYFITDICVCKLFLIFYRFRTYDWIFAHNSETIGIFNNDLRRYHDVHVGGIDDICTSVRFHCRQIPDKKTLFLVVIFCTGVVSTCFLFVPKAPFDSAVMEIKCDAETTTVTVLDENNNNNLQTTSNITYYTVANHTSSDELISCKVRIIYNKM